MISVCTTIGCGEPSIHGHVTDYLSSEVTLSEVDGVQRIQTIARLNATGYGGLEAGRYAACTTYQYAVDNGIQTVYLLGLTDENDGEVWTAKGNYLTAPQADQRTTKLNTADTLQLCRDRGIPTA